MESDLLIPLFWTIIFGGLLTIGVRRLFTKTPTKKRWVRPEPEIEKNEKNL